MEKSITFTSHWADDSSLMEELMYLRAAFAEIYQRHAPKWRGKTYATRGKYPDVDDDVETPGWTEGNNARTAVWACDGMLAILGGTKSKRGHWIAERELAQLMRWYATVHEIALTQHLMPTFMIGFEHRYVRPAKMRAAKARVTASKRKKNYERASKALERAKFRHPTEAADNRKSFLAGKAAKQLTVSISTFYRMLRRSK